MIFLTIWFIGIEILLSKTFASAKEQLSTVFVTIVQSSDSSDQRTWNIESALQKLFYSVPILHDRLQDDGHQDQITS